MSEILHSPSPAISSSVRAVNRKTIEFLAYVFIVCLFVFLCFSAFKVAMMFWT